jgi:hypothetical protein
MATKRRTHRRRPSRAGPRTITVRELNRLAFCNSGRLPQIVAHRGERKMWVGFGWVTMGKARGNEVRVLE